jgi:hypothetical protein
MGRKVSSGAAARIKVRVARSRQFTCNAGVVAIMRGRVDRVAGRWFDV